MKTVIIRLRKTHLIFLTICILIKITKADFGVGTILTELFWKTDTNLFYYCWYKPTCLWHYDLWGFPRNKGLGKVGH